MIYKYIYKFINEQEKYYNSIAGEHKTQAALDTIISRLVFEINQLDRLINANSILKQNMNVFRNLEKTKTSCKDEVSNLKNTISSYQAKINEYKDKIDKCNIKLFDSNNINKVYEKNMKKSVVSRDSITKSLVTEVSELADKLNTALLKLNQVEHDSESTSLTSLNKYQFPDKVLDLPNTSPNNSITSISEELPISGSYEADEADNACIIL